MAGGGRLWGRAVRAHTGLRTVDGARHAWCTHARSVRRRARHLAGSLRHWPGLPWAPPPAAPGATADAAVSTPGAVTTAVLATPGATAAGNLTTWRDPQGRFTIGAPSDWSPSEQPQTLFGTGVVAFHDPSGRAELNVSVD